MNETMLASECLIAASKAPIKSSLIAHSIDTNNSIFHKMCEKVGLLMHGYVCNSYISRARDVAGI